MMQDGIIYKGDQIVVPLSPGAGSPTCQSHQRVTRECLVCEDGPAQCKEKHTPQEVPKQPWKDYLVMADYLTDFFR